jgi:hypothetical protein
MTNKDISQSALIELFYLIDGILYWRVSKPHSKYKAGDVAGRKVKGGYMQVCVNRIRILNHQVVFKMFHGYVPKMIDHIDGNVKNNRIENLRPATPSQNLYNSRLSTRNKSGVKGVCWSTSNKKWQVQVSISGKQTTLGFFEDLEFADLVAREARDKYHGAFANHGAGS